MVLRRPADRHREARAQRLADPGAQPDNPPLGVERQLARRLAAAAVVGREQILRAGRDPLHRPLEPAREPRDEHLLAIRPALHAEAAADVGRDHANARLVEAEHARQRRADPERRLRRRPHRELAGDGVPAREGAARLHRYAAETLLLHGERHAVRGVTEGALCIAVAPRDGERAVVAAHRHHLRRARREGTIRIGDAREGLVVDHEPIDPVRRRVGRIGDDRRHRNSLGADDAGGEQRILGDERARRQAHERNRPDRTEVLGGEHGDHPGSSPRGGGVDRTDARVGVRAPSQDHVQHAPDRQVVDEASPSGQERLVFPAPNRSPDPPGWLGGMCHVRSPFGR